MPKTEDSIQFPESLRKFQENWTKKNPGKMPGQYHNVYQLIAEDLYGNVVDEMFAVNCMTDYGFENAYCNQISDGYQPRIVLGDGEGDIDPSSTTLISYISKTPATVSNSTLTFTGQRFYPETGMTVSRFRIAEGYYDYTIWSEDKTVTEIGVYLTNTNADNLMFHAKVYDSDGNPTSFVKKVNERLTISVYVTMNVPIAEICNKAWDKGLYILMNAYSFFKYRYGNYFNTLYTHYLSHHTSNPVVKSWFNIAGTSTKIENNIATREAGVSDGAYYEGKYEYMSEICVSNADADDDRYANTYVSALFKPKLETPLAITTDWLRTNGYSSKYFSSNFGLYNSNHTNSNVGQLPVTDIHFSSLKMYSCQDHDWTIDVPFFEPEKEPAYDIGYLKYSIWDHNYVQFLDKESWFRVYLNDRPDVPITSFNRSGLTFYASDSYWDSSTWQIIPNLSDIPNELGTKRYYITLSEHFNYSSNMENYGNAGYYTIPVSRQQETHSLITEAEAFHYNWGYFSGYFPYGDRTVSGKVISNDEYGYVASLNQLIFIESEDVNPTTGINPSITSGKQYPYRYTIYGIDDQIPDTKFIWNTTRGSHIVTAGINNYKSGFRVYTITTDPSTTPTYQDFRFDQTFSDNPHFSYSDNGYITSSYISGTNNQNITYVLEYDVSDVEPNMYSVEGYHHCHTIDLTDYFCGVNANVTDHVSLDIYDMKNREVIDTIDIPEGYGFSGMAGWKNFIYILVNVGGSYVTFVYYMNEKRLTLTSLTLTHMLIDTNSYYSHIQRAVEAKGTCESCMVLLSSTRDWNNQYHMLFKESDPENPITLTRTGDPQEVSGYVTNQTAQLRYVNDDKQLLLVLSSNRSIAYDIGWALNNGTINTVYNYQCYAGTGGASYSSFIYKKYIGLFGPHWFTSYPGSSYDRSSKTEIYLYPYEYWLNFRLEATTKTINSYHNPVRVYGVKGAKFQITNRNINDTSTSE